MYNNNIPQYSSNMQRNKNNGDRFISGGFFGPFILGGIAGGLIANSRYNYPMYLPYPYYPYPYYYRPY